MSEGFSYDKIHIIEQNEREGIINMEEMDIFDWLNSASEEERKL